MLRISLSSTALCLVVFLAHNSSATHQYGFIPTDNRGSSQPFLQWTGVDLTYPCSTTKALFKSSGKLITKNNIATRGQIYKDTIFFALPRYKKGIPATLVKTKLNRGACSVTFEPFPCWSMQEESKCSAMQSVVDLVLDGSDLLWVLDTGVVETLEDEPKQTCPPKVLALNVKTGKLMKTITFDGLLSKSSRLQYLAVDYGRDGRAFVYVSDAAARALIVYDVQASKGYRVILPKAVSEGCGKKDVLYIALTRKSCGTSTLYFTYLCSNKLFAIKTDCLRDGKTTGRIEGEMFVERKKHILIINFNFRCWNQA